MTPFHRRWEKATRYYQVDVCQDRWGQWVLIQRWGRRGAYGDASSTAIAPSVDLL